MNRPEAVETYGTGHAPVPPLLEVRGISKSFSSTTVLDGISVAFAAGEVHVLFGENGAGKSTFINILAGALRPDRGEIVIDGAATTFQSVEEARRSGIAAVFQEFSLAPHLTVEDNLVLGNEPCRGPWIRLAEIRRVATEQLRALGFAIDPKRIVSSLSRAEQQMVEIAKALLTKPRVLILDEPTASLSEHETRRLFAVIEELKARGVAIIYISHRLAEIFEIGDVAHVLRDGKLVKTTATRSVEPSGLVQAMLGRPLSALFPTIAHSPGRVLLTLEGVSCPDGLLSNVSIQVRAGEVVGLAGLVGSGKSDIGRVCYGLVPGYEGTLYVAGEPVTAPTPAGMLARGLTYVPSDRRREGLLLTRPVEENITLSILHEPEVAVGGFLRAVPLWQRAKRLLDQMGVQPPALKRLASQYSGGNQQKIMLGKALAPQTSIVILDEPTVGVDVGAKADIYEIIASLIAAGAAVLLISSDLPEIINLCHRVYVVDHGTILAEVEADDIREEVLLGHFFSESGGAECQPTSR
jgi:ribose transport system ATP-binding protein